MILIFDYNLVSGSSKTSIPANNEVAPKMTRGTTGEVACPSSRPALVIKGSDLPTNMREVHMICVERDFLATCKS